MLSLIGRFHRDDGGATAPEYAMLIVFIALAVAVGAQALGTSLNGLFSQVANTISSVQFPAGTP